MTGIYILANDRVYDWTVALLESLRAHDPDLPIVLIPFDANMSRLSAHARTYRFDLAKDSSLQALDEIGWTLAEGRPAGWIPMFRKLYAFWGPFDHAMYLDADIIALETLSDVLRAFAQSGRDFCYFDGTDEYVYRTASFIREMKARYGARLFNAGFWCARKGALSLQRVAEGVKAASAIREELLPDIMEQSAVNYLIQTAGLNYGGLQDLLPGMASHHWAVRWRRIERRDGAYRVGHRASPDFERRVKVLHWAGIRLSPLMPYRRLFLKYRLRSLPPAARLAYRARAAGSYVSGPMIREALHAAKQCAKKAGLHRHLTEAAP